MAARYQFGALPLVILAAVLGTNASPAFAADAPESNLASAAMQHGANSHDPARSGIWKALTPPGAMHGEFQNNDPIGLSAGVKIESDCSLNWVDPDSGKLYCFSSATSLVYFLNAPQSYLARAGENWLKLNGPSR